MDSHISHFYFNSGEVEREMHTLGPQGVLHNELGPAITVYREPGAVRRYEYAVDGERHREDGPAVICYGTSGNIDGQFYFLNDEKMPVEHYRIYLLANNNLHALEKTYIKHVLCNNYIFERLKVNFIYTNVGNGLATFSMTKK
jgi:NAD-dependent SIR2 family protein deacetylase